MTAILRCPKGHFYLDKHTCCPYCAAQTQTDDFLDNDIFGYIQPINEEIKRETSDPLLDRLSDHTRQYLTKLRFRTAEDLRQISGEELMKIRQEDSIAWKEINNLLFHD